MNRLAWVGLASRSRNGTNLSSRSLKSSVVKVLCIRRRGLSLDFAKGVLADPARFWCLVRGILRHGERCSEPQTT